MNSNQLRCFEKVHRIQSSQEFFPRRAVLNSLDSQRNNVFVMRLVDWEVIVVNPSGKINNDARKVKVLHDNAVDGNEATNHVKAKAERRH